jgi:hypothetical protein
MPEHTDTLRAYNALYEHQKAKDYLTKQHRNSKNSSITTKMMAAKHFGKVLHQKNPLLVEGEQKIKQELGQEAGWKKHMLLLNN